MLLAFSLTLFAGLATGIGSGVALLARHTNTRFLSVLLGFSAGVMLYVSFVEIFVKARALLTAELGNVRGTWLTVGSFFVGMLAVTLIDKLIPHSENPHEMHRVEEMDDPVAAQRSRKLFKMGLLTALAIGVHNFPEGLVTFFGALQDPSLGLALCVAIAIHNVPEGIAVAIPIYYATGSRARAFWYSFLSGVAEPVGALAGYLVLRPYLNDVVFGSVFAAVGGIMVFISLDQLLPTAEEYGEHHLAMYGVVSGMLVMALSLLLFLR